MELRIAKRFSRDEQPIQHLWMAHASEAELETQLIVGNRIGILSEIEMEALIPGA